MRRGRKPTEGSGESSVYRPPSLFGDDDVPEGESRWESDAKPEKGSNPYRKERGKQNAPVGMIPLQQIQVPDAQHPTADEWRSLYAAADAFKALAPWEWMDDSQVFAVRNPESGEMGYCCVMGMLGQFTALALYPGEEGYGTYMTICRRASLGPDPELRFLQRGLLASFEDRRDQWPEDLKVIKDLRLKYRGAGNWPLFRDHAPGLMPWFLTGSQARFLTLALLVGAEVGRRCQEEDGLFTGPQGTLPILLPELSRPSGEWKASRVVAPKPGKAKKPVLLPADEVRLKKLLSSAERIDAILEVDILHAPAAVQDEGRPYFPLLLLGVDAKTELVITMALSSPLDPMECLLDSFLSGLETQGVLPKEVLYKRENVAALLGPTLKTLKVPLRKTKSLPAHDLARQAMETVLWR